MLKKRKQTANQQEWERQVKNLKRRIKALEKYTCVDFEIPRRPKRITKKALKEIKGLSREQLIQYAYNIDPLTNQYIPYHFCLSQGKQELQWQELYHLWDKRLICSPIALAIARCE